MAGKGDNPRNYGRAIVKPHSQEWDDNFDTIFTKMSRKKFRDLIDQLSEERQQNIQEGIKALLDELIEKEKPVTEEKENYYKGISNE